jgi:hypothetical protein
MSQQKDGNGEKMSMPFKKNGAVKKAVRIQIPPMSKMMTLNQIKDAYQMSVLCQSTRRAKENGAWSNCNYCKDQVTNILHTGENEVFKRKERLFLKRQA